MRQRLFLYAVNAGLQDVALLSGFDLRFEVIDGAGEKAARAARRVSQMRKSVFPRGSGFITETMVWMSGRGVFAMRASARPSPAKPDRNACAE